MDEIKLQAGAGCAEIHFPEAMFPTNDLFGIHDAPCARILFFDYIKRAAVVSIEMVNIPDDCIDSCRKIVSDLTKTPYSCVWIHVTHAITTPHAPGGPMGPGKPGDSEKKMAPPVGFPGYKEDPDAPIKRKIFIESVEEAVRKASTEAVKGFRQAKFGVGGGYCDVNCNRDIETPFGWWIGLNPAGPSNKKMTVLKMEDFNGKIIGSLVSYAIKPCAIDMAGSGTGKREVSADITGFACQVAEAAIGAPCLFCMSAAGDQVPREMAYFDKVNEDGSVSHVDLGIEKGYEIVARLGNEMGQEIIRVLDDIHCDDCAPEVDIGSRSTYCGCKGHSPRQEAPTKEKAKLQEEKQEKLGVEVIRIGNTALVAVKPETNFATEKQMKENSPFENTLLISMVNGGMKYMPELNAYDRITWESSSALLMPGSAERWVDMTDNLLKAMSENKKQPKITAIAQPYPEGEKITKAVIEFNGFMPNPSEITIKDRNIIKRETDGNFVTLFLSPDDAKASVIPDPFAGFHDLGKMKDQNHSNPMDHDGPEQGKGKLQRPRMPERKRGPIAIEALMPGYAGYITSADCHEEIIDEFRQYEYKGIPYNLFIPENYDASIQYPIVMFIPDASANGNDPKLALSQGIGATCWAEPEAQKKHPCFVLAVQIPKEVHLTNDDYQVAPEIEIIKELLDKTILSYSIDPKRVYTTGQSQGCMASCEFNIRYPDFFAASLLVSGHWDVEKMVKLTNPHLFIGLSEGGLKEYPCMNLITDGLEKNGIKVSRVRLNFRDGLEVNNQKIKNAEGDSQVIYAVFNKDTAFPDDGKQRPQIAHHNRGWELTYQLDAALDWIMAQTRA